MNEVGIAFAKLAGILKATRTLLDERSARPQRPILQFPPRHVEQNFQGAERQLAILRTQLPLLYGDFPPLEVAPETAMAAGSGEPNWFSRSQLTALSRSLEQIFEIRSHSELAVPESAPREPRVFLSHGRAPDWREVQTFIERDIDIRTLELEQEPNLGRTVLEKLRQESERCTSAVIIMTGDDTDADGKPRARENVLHEIGYFQGRYGLSAVCLLHEEGTNIPSNIHGLVYIPFPNKMVRATFGALSRELKAFYRR